MYNDVANKNSFSTGERTATTDFRVRNSIEELETLFCKRARVGDEKKNSLDLKKILRLKASHNPICLRGELVWGKEIQPRLLQEKSGWGRGLLHGG